MHFATSLRAFPLVALMAAATALPACTSNQAVEEVGGSESEITDVPHTAVERQSIGNCWIYAQATWVESMHLAATGEHFDVSQSYWSYWHWFDQIVAGEVSNGEVNTGGWWRTANEIVDKYGLISEEKFIPADALNEMSYRQETALEAINKSLESGVLSDPAKRRDRTVVRAEMDKAWGLSASVIATLDKVFGKDVHTNFTKSPGRANSWGTDIKNPYFFYVKYTDAPGAAPKGHRLTSAIKDWHQEYYSSWNGRSLLQRVQRALHDSQPVMISWFVDFNALENDKNSPYAGSFNMTTLNAAGKPGRQGGHMTVLEDYQVKLADGTVLKAGVTLDPKNPADALKLDAALDSKAEIEFLRIKNSWGAERPDRVFAPGMPGYHDLYMDYLEGPVDRCSVDENENPDPKSCSDETPLQDVVLPPGY